MSGIAISPDSSLAGSQRAREQLRNTAAAAQESGADITTEDQGQAAEVSVQGAEPTQVRGESSTTREIQASLTQVQTAQASVRDVQVEVTEIRSTLVEATESSTEDIGEERATIVESHLNQIRQITETSEFPAESLLSDPGERTESAEPNSRDLGLGGILEAESPGDALETVTAVSNNIATTMEVLQNQEQTLQADVRRSRAGEENSGSTPTSDKASEEAEQSLDQASEGIRSRGGRSALAQAQGLDTDTALQLLA